ncbi:MAG TPA: glycoside-pentoside-hexuronide (GPH):cation symporter [Propionibacteriaceae bacterium]|nr:glycoside-pentoside-hexuronide (GPH):cation symporter [Propionibacteriaceae bacterium]
MDLVSSSVSPRRQRVSVVVAGFGQNFILTTVTTFILVYLLQYAHITVAGMAVVTGILAATKIFDAVSDPVMGSIVDRTRTRWGKMRPFILFSAMPVALFTTLLFAVPDLPESGKLVFFGVVFFLWGISYTACDVPFWGLIGSAFPDTTERTGVISRVRAFGGISLGLATLGMPWLAQLLSGGTTTATGWSLAVGISAFLGMGLYLMAFVNTRERPRHDAGEALTLRVLFTTLGRNTPLLLVLLGSALGFGRYLVQAGGAVFVVLAYRSETTFTYVGAAIISGLVLASFCTPLLMKRLTSKQLMVSSTLVATALYAGMYLAGFANLVFVLVFIFLTGLTLGVFSVVQTTMIADAVDDVERRTGVRNDGISFSTLTFVTKIMNALAVLVFGLFVVAARYQAGVVVTPAMQQVVWSAITLVPAASCLVSVVPFLFYRLGGPQRSEPGQQAAGSMAA